MLRRLTPLLAACLTLCASAVGAASASATYPVPYTTAAMVAGGLIAGASPPGSNDFSCKPSAAHPDPVVLVHGLIATQGDDWPAFAPLLANNGFCVFSLTYGTLGGNPYYGGLTAMEQSAPELAAFVDRVLAATGASKVDLLGHSEGTVMPRYWMSFLGGASKVHRYVMLTPIWKGTQFFGLAALQSLGNQYSPQNTALLTDTLFGRVCGSCPEFLSGSPFLQKLDAAGVALPGVQYTDIATRYDELVTPYTNGFIDAPNARNITLQDQCALDATEHVTIAVDPVAAQDVLNALDPEHALPVPCTAVIPGVGALNPPFVGLSSAATSGPGATAGRATNALTPAQGNAASRCSAKPSLAFVLHHRRGERVTSARAYIGRHLVLRRSGRSLTTLVVGHLPRRRFVLTIRTRGSKGSVLRSRRTIGACSKGRSHTIRAH